MSFLDLSAPRLPDVLAGVAADGHRHAVVVPLLLGSAYHARVDIPAAVAQAGSTLPQLHIATAAVLGPDPGLDAAALSRLHTALAAGPAPARLAGSCLHSALANEGHRRAARLPEGAARSARAAAGPCEAGAACPLHDPELGVVLASVGSSRESANLAVAERVAGWRERFGWAAASAAYVTAAEPSPEQAIADVRAAGARRVAVVPWVLAPGRLPDRIDAAAAAGDAVVAAPIGAHPELAAVVLRRWADAVRTDTRVRRVG